MHLEFTIILADYTPLDIPHDLIRVQIPKTLDAFGGLRHGGRNKVLGENLEDGDDEGKRRKKSIGIGDEAGDLEELLNAN